MFKIILAPDSFKGNLTSLQVATALEKGIRRVFPNANCIKLPMADGGEGTVQALVHAIGGRFVSKRVTGPLMKPVSARYGFFSDGKTAVIEMAAAAGLPLIKEDFDKNPTITTSYGVGELMLDAMNKGAKHIILGMGGSATVDAGAGAAQALGVKFLDKKGNGLVACASGGMLQKIEHIDMSAMDPQMKRMKITLASDVDNVLCGKQGAAHVFGAQKGATPLMIKELDKNLRWFAKCIKKDLHKDVISLKGAGAAGGLGAGLLAFTRAKWKRGIDVVMHATELGQHMQGANLVITGEGRVDSQTVFGKTPAGVARLAKKYKVPAIVIGGSLADDAHVLFKCGVAGLESACARDMSLEDAMLDAKMNLANAAERAVRLILVGEKIAKNKKR